MHKAYSSSNIFIMHNIKTDLGQLPFQYVLPFFSEDLWCSCPLV